MRALDMTGCERGPTVDTLPPPQGTRQSPTPNPITQVPVALEFGGGAVAPAGVVSSAEASARPRPGPHPGHATRASRGAAVRPVMVPGGAPAVPAPRAPRPGRQAGASVPAGGACGPGGAC